MKEYKKDCSISVCFLSIKKRKIPMPSVSLYQPKDAMQLINRRMFSETIPSRKNPMKKPTPNDFFSMGRKGSLSHLFKSLNRSFLPKDENEIDRMVSQHYILRTAFNGDFSAPFSRRTKLVLDMGCGSGTWTMEMAIQFPQTQFIGIDPYALFPQEIKPQNCRFLALDRYQLPFADNSVDYIFQRDANWEIPRADWNTLLAEYYRVLKPGGWIELVEPNIETQSSSSEEDFLIDTLIQAFYQKQHDPFISHKLSSLLATGGFRSIQSDFQSVPLGWGHSKSPKQVSTEKTICSEYARASAMQHLLLYQSLKPWFVNKSKTKYDECLHKILTEWSSHHSYINWHRSIAQKPYLS
ncbi:S-adenosyl-L-methionine-dependent methyltransferase [Sporodiniella umbellata]|nr:S-adenosyl-L-methionine-dependent methyltransferase [Sporodiniella umbellata]